MGKQDPKITNSNERAIEGIYVPRSAEYFNTAKEDQNFTDLDMLDYGDLLRRGEQMKSAKANRNFMRQMHAYEGGGDTGDNHSSWGAVGTGASVGATAGGALGSIVPVLGNGIGAAAGAVVGGVGGWLADIAGGDRRWKPTDDDIKRYLGDGGTLDQNRSQLYAQHGFNNGQPQTAQDWGIPESTDPFVQRAAQQLARKKTGGQY